MKVWILQTGEPLPDDNNQLRPMRAMNLCKKLKNSGHDVILWTSKFDHFTKSHRSLSNKKQNRKSIETIYIPSIGYTSNRSIKRFFDHIQMAINLKKLMKTKELPDIAFIGFPPIEIAYVMTSYLWKRNIPTIVDVKDAWPEVFEDQLPKKYKRIANFLMSPLRLLRNITFRKATSISAVTPDFLDWCQIVSKRNLKHLDSVNYLVPDDTDTLTINSESRELEELLDEKQVFRMSFAGSLNSAFDFQHLTEFLKIPNLQIVIAGDGPQRNLIEKIERENENFIYLGWINSDMVQTLITKSDIMLAPYKDSFNFRMHIPNKIFDALRFGVPILSSLQGTTKTFLAENEIGFSYKLEDVVESRELVQFLSMNRQALAQISKKENELWANRYSYDCIYGELVSKLEYLAGKP